MEAAADVLLGMAAEKIQVLVIHLSPIHTHTHTGAHCLLFSFFYKLSYKHTCMKDALTQTQTQAHTHGHTKCVQSFSLSFSLSLPSLAFSNPSLILLSTTFIYFKPQTLPPQHDQHSIMG